MCSGLLFMREVNQLHVIVSHCFELKLFISTAYISFQHNVAMAFKNWFEAVMKVLAFSFVVFLFLQCVENLTNVSIELL